MPEPRRLHVVRPHNDRETLCGRPRGDLTIWARPITAKALARPVVKTTVCADCLRLLRGELEQSA